MNALLAADQVTLADFGKDPFWLVVLKVLVIFVALLLLTLFTTWFERRVVSFMQNRPGPNRAGPFGLLQPIADGIKLAFKQSLTPIHADLAVYLLAPIIAATAAMMVFAVVPMGPMVSIFGTATPLQLTDFPVSVLYVLAIASVGIYGIVLAGWSSGSTYSLLGGLRSSAQMISYEIAMGLSFVAVFLWAGTMSMSQVVNAQTNSWWYAILLLPSFVIYLISMVGETNRAPFDLPEAEGELVGGFHTEYSSMKFALFFLAEYINMVTVSALATTLFLGGWQAPWPLSLWDGANSGYITILWWLAKVQIFIFIFIWLRGTLPRLRYDQFMKFGWKLLIPISIAWILIVATARALRNEVTFNTTEILVIGAIVIAVLLAASWILQVRADRKAALEELDAAEIQGRPFDAMAGGYPVPPMPGIEANLTSRRGPATITTQEAIDG